MKASLNILPLLLTLLSWRGISESPGRQTADGSRLDFPERGFSMVPPKTWSIITSVQGSSLVMQPAYVAGMKYQRTLQVATFQGQKVVDAEQAEAFGDYLVDKFGSRTSSVTGYRIRNFIPVTLRDGNTAMLYYAEFKIDGIDLMQSHLVVSSTTRHYIVSFTDLAEHFEGDGETSKFLSTAWESMISFQVDVKPSMQLSPAIKAALATGISVVLIGFFAFLRYRRDRAGRRYDQMAVDLENTSADADKSEADSTRVRAVTKTVTLAESNWQSGAGAGMDDDLDFDDDKVS